MKLVPCPLTGPRPLEEFVYGGEVRTPPDPASTSDADWARWLYERSGAPGIKREWWYHAPSGSWFVAVRDTLTGEFIGTAP